MSVMTQSQEPSPSTATNSSADANPRTLYPNEQSDSTSAVRNDSSSSMTAIKSSLDTHHPFPWVCPQTAGRGKGFSHVTGVPGNYPRGRSGERRVGEEWRSRWSADDLKKKKENQQIQ